MQNRKKVCGDCGKSFTEKVNLVAEIKPLCPACRKKHTQANAKDVERLSKARYKAQA